jgi:hypothetical protein
MALMAIWSRLHQPDSARSLFPEHRLICSAGILGHVVFKFDRNPQRSAPEPKRPLIGIAEVTSPHAAGRNPIHLLWQMSLQGAARCARLTDQSVADIVKTHEGSIDDRFLRTQTA